jgi:hypothetical protein
MPVCDICGTPGTGALVSSEDMRRAVYKKGFNPYALGLAMPFPPLNSSQAFEGWKNTIVAQDTSDWNICARCMSRLRPCLGGEPKPTGVTKATVSVRPLAATVAKQILEKQKAEQLAREVEPRKKDVEPPKPKKRWQFWKK